MNKLTVSQEAEEKLRKGILLLDKKDFGALSLQNQCVELQNRQGKFLGTAYLSPQNKGVGWLISQKKVELNSDFFQTLFEQAKSRRSTYFHSADMTAFRLFNQEGDGFGGFTVDFYNDFALFSWYNDFVFAIKEQILTAFAKVFPEIQGAYEKIRFKGLNYESDHLYGAEAPETFTVLENSVRYQVFLNDGLMTGIFLDQRDVRASLVDGLAAGKSLLNMFSYTAAFSVAKDYHRLVAQALEILNPRGIMILSTNAANLSKSKFKQEIEKGLAGRKHRYLAEYGLPADFVYNKKDGSSNYLKVFTIKVDQ